MRTTIGCLMMTATKSYSMKPTTKNSTTGWRKKTPNCWMNCSAMMSWMTKGSMMTTGSKKRKMKEKTNCWSLAKSWNFSSCSKMRIAMTNYWKIRS